MKMYFLFNKKIIRRGFSTTDIVFLYNNYWEFLWRTHFYSIHLQRKFFTPRVKLSLNQKIGLINPQISKTQVHKCVDDDSDRAPTSYKLVNHMLRFRINMDHFKTWYRIYLHSIIPHLPCVLKSTPYLNQLELNMHNNLRFLRD